MEEIIQHSHNLLEGQYLIFGVGQEKYAFPIFRIQEIMGAFPLTSVPNTKPYIKGVINLRGKIIPVFDLRTKLSIPFKDFDDRTCFVVVSSLVSEQNTSLAIIVDYVEEVVRLDSSNIEQAPDFGNSDNSKFVLGVGKSTNYGNQAITLLDIDLLVVQ